MTSQVREKYGIARHPGPGKAIHMIPGTGLSHVGIQQSAYQFATWGTSHTSSSTDKRAAMRDFLLSKSHSHQMPAVPYMPSAGLRFGWPAWESAPYYIQLSRPWPDEVAHKAYEFHEMWDLGAVQDVQGDDIWCSIVGLHGTHTKLTCSQKHQTRQILGGPRLTDRGLNRITCAEVIGIIPNSETCWDIHRALRFF